MMLHSAALDVYAIIWLSLNGQHYSKNSFFLSCRYMQTQTCSTSALEHLSNLFSESRIGNVIYKHLFIPLSCQVLKSHDILRNKVEPSNIPRNHLVSATFTCIPAVQTFTCPLALEVGSSSKNDAKVSARLQSSIAQAIVVAVIIH